jgi:hypothetical protein
MIGINKNDKLLRINAKIYKKINKEKKRRMKKPIKIIKKNIK